MRAENILIWTWWGHPKLGDWLFFLAYSGVYSHFLWLRTTEICLFMLYMPINFLLAGLRTVIWGNHYFLTQKKHAIISKTLRPDTLWPPVRYRFGVASAYYGISFSISSLGVSIYLSQFLYGVIEIPSKVFAYFTLDRIGRRPIQSAAAGLTSLCILCNMFIPKGKRWKPKCSRLTRSLIAGWKWKQAR